MDIKKAATTRFISYIFSFLIQIGTIFLLTIKLEIYQFSVWGIFMSLLFLLSTIFQLSYVQSIEKYFPNFNINKRQYLFTKYLKTIIFCFPVILLFLVLINYFGYFEKFNIENIFYLLIMLSSLTIIESCLAISDVYFVSTKNSEVFDKFDLLISKIPKIAIFYFLLINNYSVFYLIFVILILRLFFLIFIVRKEFNSLTNFLYSFFKNPILKDNFLNTKYNVIAFANKTIYLSLINILFLLTSNFLLNIDIAHYSIMVLILNSLRPIMNTIPILLSPIIANSIKDKLNINIELQNFAIINQIIIAISLFTVLLVVKFNYLIEFLFINYFEGIYDLILLSFLASTLNSIYQAKYLQQLFNNEEVNILKFNILNYGLSITFYFVIFYYFYLINFIYIYMLYEFLYFLYITYLGNQRKNFNINKREISITYSLSLFMVILNIINLEYLYYFLFVPVFLYFDFKRTSLSW